MEIISQLNMYIIDFLCMKSRFVIISGLFVLMSAIMISPTFADQASEIVVTKHNFEVVKTTIPMYIPTENILPWASVSGIVENHVNNHPIIIQIYQNDEPVHFAQTNVNDDGSYEYKFRVKTVNDDKIINIFEGNYEVRIFKTINKTFDYSV